MPSAASNSPINATESVTYRGQELFAGERLTATKSSATRTFGVRRLCRRLTVQPTPPKRSRVENSAAPPVAASFSWAIRRCLSSLPFGFRCLKNLWSAVALPPPCLHAQKSPSRSIVRQEAFASVAASFSWAIRRCLSPLPLPLRFVFRCHPERGPPSAPTRHLSSIATAPNPRLQLGPSLPCGSRLQPPQKTGAQAPTARAVFSREPS